MLRLQRPTFVAATLVAAFCYGFAAIAAPRLLTRVERADDIRKELGLTDELLRLSSVKTVKVAVLDAGFAGVEAELRDPTAPRYLPVSTELIASYPGKEKLPALDPADAHGLHLAQIIYAMTGYGDGPQFRLYNANGPGNFVEAVKSLIAWKADVVVCSRNWETFGNFDGKGFINKAVEEATDEGILWFQAAGNYHDKVFNGPIRTHAEKVAGADTEWVNLPFSYSYVRFKNHVDDNNVTITLSWNAFDPGEEALGTKKDLNLYVYQNPGKTGEGLKLIGSSRLTQVEEKPADDSETLHPRERITKRLRASGANDYLIAVQKMGGTFDPAKDKLRITVTGDKQPFVDGKTEKRTDPIEMLDATDDGEIMVPADNRYVITVGDLSPQSARGPTADGRGKPEILFPRSNVNFTDRNAYYGTSYAAAYMAAVGAVLKGREPLLARAHVLRFRTNDPKKLLKASGWDAESPFKVLWDNEHVRSKFGSLLPSWDRVAVRGNVDGYPSVGFLDKFKDVKLFDSLSESVKNDPDKYDIYVSPNVTPTVKTVQDPPTTRRGPDQQVLETPARYVNRSKYIGTQQGGVVQYGNLIGVVPSYNVYLNYQELVPATYRTVPGQTYQVPGVYRQVPGDPIVSFSVHSRLKGTTSPSFWFEVDDKKYPRASYIRLERATVVSTEGKGSVVDGSDKQPKLWDTPNATTLRSVVGGTK